MKICCVSDTHGYLPEIPDCDLLLLAGDYCPVIKNQYIWFNKIFAPWLKKLSQRMKVIGIAGNHDFMFERTPELIPEMDWTYLQDNQIEFQGIKIFGSPWQIRFFNWAFNLDEPELNNKWDKIPEDTDILLLHGPPYGYGDFSLFGNTHCGSRHLLEKIEKIQPKLVVYGHIHAGYGVYHVGESKLINASVVNDKYELVNQPIVVELDIPKT